MPRCSSATLNGTALDVSAYREDDGIALPGLAAENELVVVATGRYMNTGEGLHRFVDPVDGAVYLYSQFETADAKRMFACFDQPDLKARYTLTVTAPADWKVVSNATAEVEQAGPAAVHRFATTEILSTYLVALVAGPYAEWRDEHVDDGAGEAIPLGIYCRASLAEHMDAERLFTETKQGFDFYHRNFGIRYPFGKYDQLFVPEFNAGAMENAGAVTFLEDYVFRTRVTRSTYERRAETVLHEMAHMWFGDLVTMALVGRPVAERVVRDVRERALPGHGHRVRAGVDDVRERREELGLPPGPAALHPPGRRGHPGPAGRRGQLRRDHLRQGRVGAQAARRLRRARSRSSPGCAPTSRPTRGATPRSTTCSARWRRPRGATCPAGARSGCKTTGLNLLRPSFELDDGGAFTRFDVVQGGARPGAGELRTHRIAVGVYDDDGSGKLVRTHRVEVDVEGERTAVPELVGESRGKLVLVNDDDLTYCALRLDPGSLATLIDRIGDIAEPLPRTLCWSSAWEMTREAELKARDFSALVAGGFGAETEIGVVQRLLLQAQTAIMSYADEQWAAERGWPVLVDALRVRLDTAEAGSDAQLAVVNSLAGSVLPEAVLERFRGWLSGVDVPEGLTVDTDLRWRLLHALVAHGSTGGDPEALIAAEQAARRHVHRAAAGRAGPRADPDRRGEGARLAAGRTRRRAAERGQRGDHQRVLAPRAARAAHPLCRALLRGRGGCLGAADERARPARGDGPVPGVGRRQGDGGRGRRVARRSRPPACPAAVGVGGARRDRPGAGRARVRPVLTPRTHPPACCRGMADRVSRGRSGARTPGSARPG